MARAEPTERPIRIGISACLLGENVRWDAGHKHDRFITDTLGQYFDWVPVCPEVEIGLGVPRPPIRLEEHDGQIRLVMPQESRDLTETMRSYARRRVAALVREELCGYLLKKNSPSCGLERVKVHAAGKNVSKRSGRGLFAEILLGGQPHLPVEEEGRLHDPRLRENWIVRVFAYHRLRSLWASRWKLGDLVALHSAHKYLLLAHEPTAYTELGRMVAQAKSLPRAELRERYEARFMTALAHLATPRRHVNVLQHMVGFFKKHLDAPARQALLEQIEDYRQGYVPLIVPVTLINHYVRLLDVPYLRDQVYLNPHPKELALRNHV
jgi:uncharacterized protein YbgA (DUF1722 family)/uncharacterized protein YbbK (DUF523 family)